MKVWRARLVWGGASGGKTSRGGKGASAKAAPPRTRPARTTAPLRSPKGEEHETDGRGGSSGKGVRGVPAYPHAACGWASHHTQAACGYEQRITSSAVRGVWASASAYLPAPPSRAPPAPAAASPAASTASPAAWPASVV